MIGLDELVWALQQLELVMNEQDYLKLFSHYQKNWNQPKINWRELVANIRGEVSEARVASIRAAYEKLDPEQLSKCTVDDVAKSYNVAGSRDVSGGLRTDEQHYQTFMGLWNAKTAEDQVNFDMFKAFFDNISTGYESDEAFCDMMKNCWGL